MLTELSAFCSECASLGHLQVTLRFGWDSDIEFEELWKPYEVPACEVLEKVKGAEMQGIVKVGASDVLVAVPGVELTLCHEGDLHLKGVGALFDEIATRWQATGLQPSEVQPSSFSWPGKA